MQICDQQREILPFEITFLLFLNLKTFFQKINFWVAASSPNLILKQICFFGDQHLQSHFCSCDIVCGKPSVFISPFKYSTGRKKIDSIPTILASIPSNLFLM